MFARGTVPLTISSVLCVRQRFFSWSNSAQISIFGMKYLRDPATWGACPHHEGHSLQYVTLLFEVGAAPLVVGSGAPRDGVPWPIYPRIFFGGTFRPKQGSRNAKFNASRTISRPTECIWFSGMVHLRIFYKIFKSKKKLTENMKTGQWLKLLWVWCLFPALHKY